MRKVLLVAVLLAPVLFAAAPPGRMERKPRKEPTYQSKTPRYGVITFGRQQEVRMWVVLDGDTLYVDRNADGDLTAANEKKQFVARVGDSGEPRFEFGNLIRIGGKKAELAINPGKTSDWVQLRVGGTDYRLVIPGPGGFRFATRPEQAPVIPFEGALQMKLVAPTRLVADGREHTLTAYIGTPLPNGGFVAVSMHWPPLDVHPVAELTFANKKRGGPPITLTVRLDRRC